MEAIIKVRTIDRVTVRGKVKMKPATVVQLHPSSVAVPMESTCSQIQFVLAR